MYISLGFALDPKRKRTHTHTMEENERIVRKLAGGTHIKGGESAKAVRSQTNKGKVKMKTKIK